MAELNPFSHEFHEDPYPTYRWLRDNAPCYRNESLGFWALTLYEDVLAASRDWATYSSADGPMIEKIERSYLEAMPLMIAMDGLDHDVLRALVSRVFTPRRVASLEPEIRAIAAGYLDRVQDTGGGDFVADFAALLPMDVIFTLLGVPSADRLQVRHWMDTSLERDEDSPEIPARAMKASGDMAGYWFETVDRLRRQPQDDLISRLLEVEIDAGAGERRRLTDPEVAGFCALIGAAGNETVTKLLANAVVLLSRYGDQRGRLEGDPSLTASALEETLRYWAPSQYQGRTATHDVALHGTTIPAGDRVILVTGSANRDERVYADADSFDIGRQPEVVGLGFGYGAHFCLGAALARMESRIALEAFLERFPTYGIDEAGLRRVHMSNVHGFEHVPFLAQA